MNKAPVRTLLGRVARLVGSGTIATLALLLLALWAVFAIGTSLAHS